MAASTANVTHSQIRISVRPCFPTSGAARKQAPCYQIRMGPAEAGQMTAMV